MSVRYGVTELCCALKPATCATCSTADETVVYLDSDVRSVRTVSTGWTRP